MGPSLGAREEMELMTGAEQVHVSAAGPIHVDGLSDEEIKHRDSRFHTFLHSLVDLFRMHEDEDGVTVGSLRELVFSANPRKGLQRCSFPKLGTEHPE